MRRFGIAICLLSLWAAPAWAEDENPDPPPDEDVNCPEGTTPMEGGDSCETEPGEVCPIGWTQGQHPEDPGGPGDDDETYECSCEGTTDPLGNCDGDPDLFECTDGYIELEGMDTCVLDPDDVDGLGQNGEPCPWGFEQVGGDEWGICYCPGGQTVMDGAACGYTNQPFNCSFGSPTCGEGTDDPCWCSNCPDGWEIAPHTADVCIPVDYGGFPANQPPPWHVVMWGQDHVERLDFDPVNEGYAPSPQIHWYTGTDVCNVGYVALDEQCVEACTIWELPCVDDPDALYVYDPKIWVYE